MKCKNCKKEELKKIKIGDIEIDYCKSCESYWFEEDELRKIKDNEIESAKWFDFDLWKDFSKLKAIKSSKNCPKCNVSTYELNYADSEIKIDVCKKCKGFWLNRNELKKIIHFIKDQSNYEILHNYTTNYFKELGEIFTGPESVGSEINDFLIISSMFKYKFLTQHPKLSKFLMENVPK